MNSNLANSGNHKIESTAPGQINGAPGSNPYREDERMEDQDQPQADNGSSTIFTDQNPENENRSLEQRTEQDIIAEKSMRYEYYVNYKGLDRRLERWVTEHFIRVDD